MKVVRILITIFLVSILASCNNRGEPEVLEKLEYYALRRGEESGEWIRDEEPLFTGNDILDYEWESHTITFTDAFLAKMPIVEDNDYEVLNGSKILRLYYPDRFSVYLKNEEIYMGDVEPQAFISFYPGGPIIKNSDNGIMIDCMNDELDTRYDEGLSAFLEQVGLLK